MTVDEALPKTPVTDNPYDALLDAFNEAVFHDKAEEMVINEHVEEILNSQGFEVKEVEGDIASGHVTAKFCIEGTWKRIIA